MSASYPAELQTSRVRAVAFDVRALAMIGDRRDPWREILRLSRSSIDPLRFRGTIVHYAAASGVPWEAEWAGALEAELGSIAAYDDAATTIIALRAAGYPICVTGHLPAPYTDAMIDAVGVPFDVVIPSNRLHGWLPAHAMYSQICSYLDIAPDQLLVIGDTRRSHIEDARRLGMQVLHVERGQPPTPNTLLNLNELVERLGVPPPCDAAGFSQTEPYGADQMILEDERRSRSGSKPPGMPMFTARKDPISDEALARVRVVAFAAYGTLVDLPVRRGAWSAIRMRSVRDIDPCLRPGKLQDYASDAGVTWDPAWAEELQAELDGIAAYEDTVPALAVLQQQGFRLAVIGNMPQPYVEPLREQLGHPVSIEIYSCYLGALIPQPVVYAALCAEANVMPSEVLVVGDMITADLNAPRRFGMLTLPLLRGQPSTSTRVSSLQEVAERLGAARSRMRPPPER